MTLSSSAKTQEIPSYLIYEMDDGKPIYYKGYKEVLAGTKDFDRKNRQLFEFGVKKIIWIFTEVQMIKVLVPGEDMQHFEWEEDIIVMEGVLFNLQKIMDQLL